MAHYKRKRSRTASSGYYSNNGLKRRLGDAEKDLSHWTTRYPRWWDKVMHTRPSRARTRLLEHRVRKGEDTEDMTWPDGRKPHVYYW